MKKLIPCVETVPFYYTFASLDIVSEHQTLRYSVHVWEICSNQFVRRVVERRRETRVLVLVSVFVRNEEIHSLFQKLSEGLSSLGSKTKMLSLDQCDELMIIYDTILIEVDLSTAAFHVIIKNKPIHGCLTSSIILSFNGFGTDSFHTGSSSRISMNGSGDKNWS